MASVESRRRALSRISGLCALLAAAAPPLVIAGAVARHARNVPLQDQWTFVPMVLDGLAGRIGFGALWTQNNEHRLVLPRLLLVGLARLTAWDVRVEMACNLLVALATLALLAALVRRTVGPTAPGLVAWLVATSSVFVFSPVQWQNWLWG